MYKGKLYIVATPIGNPQDITLRALEVLKAVNFIVCEELKEGRKFLSEYSIKKNLIPCNEHNEKEVTHEIVEKIKKGESCALISDCGTPLFSDPGHYLVRRCIEENIIVTSLPGASSLTTALSLCNLNVDKFYYFGWLSPKKDLRHKELLKVKKQKDVLVFLDTPYRLTTLVRDVAMVFNKKAPAVLAFQLTMEEEEIFRMPLGELVDFVEKRKLKGEFVFLIDNR